MRDHPPSGDQSPLPSEDAAARFADALDRFGQDLSRWPADLSHWAQGFKAQYPQVAERLLADARALDAMLSLDTAAPVSAALQSRIMANLPPQFARQPVRVVKPTVSLWERLRKYLLPSVGLVAAATAAFAFGLTNLPLYEESVFNGYFYDPAASVTADSELDEIALVLAWSLDEPGNWEGMQTPSTQDGRPL